MKLAEIATGLRPPLLLLLAVAALGAAACSSTDRLEGETPPKAVMRGHATPAQAASHADADAKLLALGIKYRRVPNEETAQGCVIENGVEITAIGDVKLTRPALLTQDMAIRLGQWMHQVVQPEARKAFGAQVASIDVGGSYSCRNVYGRPFGGKFAGRLSEHAFANAIDIGGYKLSDGRDIAYLRNWRTPGGPSQFLQATGTAACDIFNTTLTPDYDRFHANHIHLDASPKKEDTNKFCGMKGRFAPGAVPAFARYKAPGKKWRPGQIKKKKPVKKRAPAKRRRSA